MMMAGAARSRNRIEAILRRGRRLFQNHGSPVVIVGEEGTITPPSPGSNQPAAGTATVDGVQKPIRGRYWLEWLVIFIAVTLFCTGILDLRSATNLPGNEAETFQMLDWTLVNSLKIYHAFPLWNIYIQSGIPYIADPMLHVYNPVVTLPVLLFGVNAGFKLGVYFSFLIAALGMWRLARVLGMSWPARIWAALMFTFAGQPVARFFQGQYLFIFGFAYIPWIISNLILLAQRQRKREIALAAISIALLFFSGNAYYPLYMLMVIGLLGLVMLVKIKGHPPFLGLVKRRWLAFLGVGILSLGLIAVQLLPTAEFWPRLSKSLSVAGSHTLQQIFLDYTSTDTVRPDAYSVLPAREEFYAYIGLTPFLGLALLPLALWKRDKKIILFFLLVLLLTVGWISLEWMPWKDAFLDVRLFLQFRHLLRILVFGSFALITLAAIGLDTLWQSLNDQLAQSTGPQNRAVRILAVTGLVLVVAFLVYGIGELYVRHKPIVESRDVYQPADEVMNWVRQSDPGDYYIRHSATNAWQAAVLSHNLRYLDVWYHFADIRSLEGKINQRLVQATPKYLTKSTADPAPAGAELVAVVDNYEIYSLPDSLPMAFVVDQGRLQSGAGAGNLSAADVLPIAHFFSSTNRLEIISGGTMDQILVVMMTHYPGWQVWVDGVKHELKNVEGYLATAIQPGMHKYVFIYSPRPFFVGLGISILATGIVLGLFISDLGLGQRERKPPWHSISADIQHVRQRWASYWRRLISEKTKLVNRLRVAPSRQAPDRDEEAILDGSAVMDAEFLLEASRGGNWIRSTRRLAVSIRRAIPLEVALFSLAICIYLSTRLIGLENFPIYFFTDEAVQTVMAEHFVHNDMRNYDGELLPTYFNKNPTYNLSSVSVYLQVIPYLIFGKSVFVTRAVSVFVSMLGALAVGLILRDIFKQRYWWCGILLLSIAPAWFLHSRTAFETVEMTSFYAGFLYFYLRYRYISPKALYPALVMGALVFYTYSPGQLIILVTGLFLFFSDLRYHWRNRWTALGGLALLVVLAIPYLRYLVAHPGALMQQLTTRASFWAQNITIWGKLGKYFTEYVRGLNPAYWFFPNQYDLQRHLMKGYGHLFAWTLPFFSLGSVILLGRLRLPAHRAILFALLATPSGSALAGVGITRLLAFVIPAVIVMALGLDLILTWLEKGMGWIILRWRSSAGAYNLLPGISLTIGVILGLINVYMLRDALMNGPTWYQDYTLAGMQYGARQLFSAVKDYMVQHPDAELIVSPSWTNGADAVAEFFLPPGAKVKLGSVEGHLYQRLPISANLVFVMMPVELDKVVSSGKFQNMRVDEVLPYPNGAPGFYFVHLQYVDNIDQILAAEQETRLTLQQATLLISGKPAQVGYSTLDMGSIDLLFDGDDHTVARTLEANPFIVELTFPDERQVSGYRLVIGSADVSVTTLLYPGISEQPEQSIVDFHGSVGNPNLEVSFEHQVTARKVRFEIYQPYSGVPANVHIWELELK